MKNTLKTIALGAITIFAVSCASQKTPETSQTPPPSGPQGRPQGQGGQQGPPTFASLLAQMDANKDGKLEKGELTGRIATEFATFDSDKDGFITETEFNKAPRPERPARRN